MMQWRDRGTAQPEGAAVQIDSRRPVSTTAR